MPAVPTVLVLAISLDILTDYVLATVDLCSWRMAFRARLGSFGHGCFRGNITLAPGRLCRTFTFAPGFRSDIRHDLKLRSINALHNSTTDATLNAHPLHVGLALQIHAVDPVPPHNTLRHQRLFYVLKSTIRAKSVPGSTSAPRHGGGHYVAAPKYAFRTGSPRLACSCHRFPTPPGTTSSADSACSVGRRSSQRWHRRSWSGRGRDVGG